MDLYAQASQSPHVTPVGLACHIGSQITDLAPLEAAFRVLADAEAYATNAIAEAIKANGLEAAQYNVAMRQVEALTEVARGEGKQTVLIPAQALEAFSNAFAMLRGR